MRNSKDKKPARVFLHLSFKTCTHYSISLEGLPHKNNFIQANAVRQLTPAICAQAEAKYQLLALDSLKLSATGWELSTDLVKKASRKLKPGHLSVGTTTGSLQRAGLTSASVSPHSLLSPAPSKLSNPLKMG